MDYGFLQEIFEISATKKHNIGTYRVDQRTGNGYRYAKAGGTLVAGYATTAVLADAEHVDEAGSAYAVGARQLTLTVSAGVVVAADNFADGYFQICDGGLSYGITSNSALAVGGTSITISLDRPLQVAITTSSEFSLYANPWMDVTSSSADEMFCTGICPVAVTDNYYYWSQTHGVAAALILGTPAVGSEMIYSPDGALAVVATASDVDVPKVGTMWGSVGVGDDFGSVFMQID